MGEAQKIIRAQISQRDLPLWTRIGPPVEELTGSGWYQTDIPHLIGWLQSFPAGPAISPMCLMDNGATICRFEPPASPKTDFHIERRTVCPSPFFLNSGAHRVVFDTVFNSKKFLVAIEEIEDWLCRYKGEMFYIAPQDESARSLAMAGGKNFALELLGAIVFQSTGRRLNLSTNMRRGNPGDKIGVAIVTPDEITSDGCRLTEAASRCFLYRR